MGSTSVLLGVLLAPTLAAADEPRDGIYRIEIYQGPYRSVEYVSKAPGDEAALRERGRYETEAALADDLASLKLQYVRGEQMLDLQRRTVQAQLYGMSTESTTSSYLGYGFGGGYGGMVAGYPLYAMGGYGFYGGYPYWNAIGGTTTVSRGLQYGVGDEGDLKRSLVRSIAGDAGGSGGSGRPVARNTAVGIPPKPQTATLTLKNNEKIKGELQQSNDPDWILLKDGKSTVRVRTSEVLMMRIEDAGDAVKPAVDK
jgi:hypothetical protein